MSISDRAVLVEMNISVWTAQIIDKSATEKVATDNHATLDAGKYTKNLMAGTRLRKDIADFAALCRTWHNGRTLSWHDKGARLLPTSMFLDYKTEADARRDRFMVMRDTFGAKYSNLMATAAHSLGAMFNPDDYPSLDEVMGKFDFRLVFSPVPESGDFRLDVGAEAIADLKQQYDDAYNRRLADAMQSSWTRLHDMLTSMSDKLTDTAEGKAKLFHGTWVNNVHDLCDLLRHLNVTNDPKLEQARADLVTAMGNLDVDDIKSDADVRADLKSKVDAAIKKYSW